MQLTREEYLTDASEIILAELIQPHFRFSEELSIKTSAGYAPNTRTGSKVRGVCIVSSASESGDNEIFISPAICDSITVLSVLAHELIHAVFNNKHGHTGPFKQLARAIGFTGNMQTATPNDKLRADLHDIVTQLGPYPHAKINLSELPRQKNRNLKVWCNCGFKFNTSKTQIDKVLTAHNEIQCPLCFKEMITE